jgi:hypothetical protein
MARVLSKFTLSLAAGALLVFMAGSVWAQQPLKNPLQTEKGKYEGKSQILTLKGELLGGEFRISNVIPLRGDFSKYERIEVSRLRSLIGEDISDTVLAEYGKHLFREFQRGGRFNDLVMIEEYEPPASEPQANPTLPLASSDDDRQIEEEEARDRLEGPMLTWDHLRRFDGLRARRSGAPPGAIDKPPPTLVIVGEVVDYTKGNSWLQLLPLNLGNSVFTIRFRYYDKETGEEVGRQVITGEVSSANLGGLLGLRSALSGIVEGVVDQITRRTVSAER